MNETDVQMGREYWFRLSRGGSLRGTPTAMNQHGMRVEPQMDFYEWAEVDEAVPADRRRPRWADAR